MNIRLPVNVFLGLFLWVCFFVSFTPVAGAVTIAAQEENYSSSLNVWQAIQELGNNLSGTLTDFTFRVSASFPNNQQFDFTAQNSRIIDKENNTSVYGCIPDGANPSDGSRGLSFTATGVPSGYQNVTIDFSCRNYTFISGHRYLIHLTNANYAAFGGMRMRLAAAAYGSGSNDYFTGGGLRYAYDNGSCNPVSYIWNSQTRNNGCNIFTNPKDDLFFVLSNNSPPPRLPVIFIPGIGGSEMKASQDIIWSAPDGHGGTYSHAYPGNENIWVNQDEAANLGNDDYFDVLRLKADGQTAEADLSLTGNLTPYGYSDIDSFFTGMGYTKGTNFFVLPYDWRKDIRLTGNTLDALIESAKTLSGQSKVNLVVHSMGGLAARYYISDPAKASKVNKLIELGVPHLGSVDSLKTVKFGSWLGYDFKIIKIGIPPSQTKDIAQNLPSVFQLLPSSKYFDFYSNSLNLPYPFRDDRDIDNNSITGALNFNAIKTLLSNLNYNMTVFNFGEQFHDSLDPFLNQSNGATIYEIVGTAQPTLGQIRETWWITWPVNLLPKRDEIFINGDGTVPLYSASLKNDSTDLSGAFKIYYVEQEHGDLVSGNGTAMQTVRAILDDDNSLPVEVKELKISLEGQQISLDDGELDLYDEANRHCGLNAEGEIEENIPDVTCTTSGNTKHAFVKKKAAKLKVKTTRKNPSVNSKTTALKIRIYAEDQISKTILYKDLPISQTAKIEFDLDPAIENAPPLALFPDETKPENTTITATAEVSGEAAFDQTPPSTSSQVSGGQNSGGIYSTPVTITLTANDTGSGILRTEYSVDNGQTVQIYTAPFTVSSSGETTVQIKSIDNTGNEEIPQSLGINIAASPSPSPAPSPASNSSTQTSSTDTASSTSATSAASGITGSSEISGSTIQKSSSLLAAPEILGVQFSNPSHIADEINLGGLLDQQKKLSTDLKPASPILETLGGLLLISGGAVTIISLCLLATLFKPVPK